MRVTKAYLQRELTRYRDEVRKLRDVIQGLHNSLQDAETRATSYQSERDEYLRALVDLESDLHHARRRIQEAHPANHPDAQETLS